MSSEGSALSTRLAVITARQVAGRDICLLTLQAEDGAPLPPATPGAHIDVHLPDGRSRQYSLLSSAPYTIAIKAVRDGRGASQWLHDTLSVGDTIRIGTPRNNFGLREGATDTVLLAGGIGVTALLCMYDALVAGGHTVCLHYWARSVEETFLHAQLSGRPGLHIHACGGRVTSMAAVIAEHGPQADLYCCGPTRMLAEFTALTQGRDPSTVHIERFEADSAAMPIAADEGFSVRLARSGTTIAVGKDQSILEALTDAGVDIEYSCEEGLCGACEVRLLEGDPLHRDSVRTPNEHDQRRTIMLCVSRARSGTLVLDL
ncbi:MAG: PDR/VanB family oxidoreductase [Acetobacter papayae]